MRRLWRSLAPLRRVPLLAAVGLVSLMAGLLAAAALTGGDDSGSEQARTAQPVSTAAPTTTSEVRLAKPTTSSEREPAEKPRKRRRFLATSRSVKRLFEEQLGERAGSGEPRVTAARCAQGRCRVRYISDSKGFGRQRSDQREILAQLFADPSVREVELLAHHQTVGRHKDERLPILEVTCDRAAFRANACEIGKRTGRHREAPHSLPVPGEPSRLPDG